MAVHILKHGTLDLSEYCVGIEFAKENNVQAKNIQGRHGVLLDSLVTREITVIRARGTLKASTSETLRNTLSTWNGLMGTTRKNLYAVHADRFYKAFKRRFEWNMNPASALTEAGWAIEWVADDPFVFYDDGFGSELVDSTAFSLASGDPNPKTFSVTSNGSLVTFGAVSFTAGADNGQPHIVRNVTRSREYRYSGTLSPGDVVVLDFRNFTVKKNGVNDLNNWDGGIISLDPGVNSFQVEGRFGSGTVQSVRKT